jgi:hypothetical protein
LRQEVAILRDILQRQQQDLFFGPPDQGNGKGKGKGKGKGNVAPQPAPGAGPDQEFDAIDGLATGLPVVRGGGWDQSAPFQRVSARFSYYGPTLRVSDIGFRVVRESVVQ